MVAITILAFHRLLIDARYDYIRVARPKTVDLNQLLEFQDYHVPKGWKTIAGIYTTLQDKHVFTEPDRFDPDRFGPERSEDGRQENSYVPQGGGTIEGHR